MQTGKSLIGIFLIIFNFFNIAPLKQLESKSFFV